MSTRPLEAIPGTRMLALDEAATRSIPRRLDRKAWCDEQRRIAEAYRRLVAQAWPAAVRPPPAGREARG